MTPTVFVVFLVMEKEIVLNEAIQMLKEHGYKGLTMDKLALTLKTSKKRLYDQFEDKEHLVLEALVNEFNTMYSELDLIRTNLAYDANDRLRASLWLITRRAMECSQQLVSDLTRSPQLEEVFWQHVDVLGKLLSDYYLQTSAKLNRVLLASFFGILINTLRKHDHGIDHVSFLEETVEFYTYAWLQMSNDLKRAS